MKKGFFLFSVFILLQNSSAFALAPPTGQETLCTTEGIVTRLLQEEASDGVMNGTILVPVVVLQVSNWIPADPSKSGFCESLSRPSNLYRLCDNPLPSLHIGDRVKGIAGKSLGGGPYCIENIIILR